MNKINIEEMKRYLKRSLKKKIKITTSLIVLFMMSNSIGMATQITIDSGKIGSYGRNNSSRGSIALNPKTENDSAVQHQVVKDYAIAIGVGAEANNSDSVSIGHSTKANAVNSVAIGKEAEVTSEENDAIAIGYQARVMRSDKTSANGEAGSIAIGKNARTWLIKGTAIGIDSEVVSMNLFDKSSTNGGGQGLAVGSGSKAVDQATSLGNETFAIGRSSIAIGSDDNDQFKEQISKQDFDHYFKKLYKVIDKDGSGYGYDENGNLRAPNKLRYSPTLAAGEGGIALGTRALSYGIGSTSIGAFSYALGNYSTAMGAKTRAEGDGAIAIGNETKVFSDNSVAVGNKNEVSENGGMAYGFNAISSGNNTIAIGSNVYGNVDIKTDVTSGVHDRYNNSANDDFTVSTIDTDFEDKNNKLTETLKKLEGLYKDSQSYTTTALVDKKLKFNGKEESTGKKVKPSSGNNAIVIGTDSVAKGENSITFGHAAFGMKDNTVSIGSYTYVNGKNSLGLGIASRVFSDNSLSIGVGSVITHNANNSLVFGNSSVVKSKNSLAIGNYSKAELENSISIGNHSNTDYKSEWLEEAGYAPKGAISTLTSKGIGVVSIGTIGKERRLTNLASGYRDTDAVNVSQLRSLEEKLSTVNPDDEDSSMMNYLSVEKKNANGEGYKAKEIAMKEVYYKEYIKLKAKALEMEVRKTRNEEHFKKEYTDKIDNRINELEKKGIKAINDAKTDAYGKYNDAYIKDKTKTVDSILKEISESKDAALAKKQTEILTEEEIKKVKASNYNNDGATGADSIALGYGANAKGNQAVAIGKNAEGNGSQSVVIGSPNSSNSKKDEDTDSNIGEISAGTSSVSVGNGVKSGNYAVGIGGNVVAGETAVAIGDRARAIGKFGIAIGEKAKVEKENGIAFGNTATSTEKNAIAIGNNSKATKENAIALGQGAKSEQNDSVAIGNGSEANSSTAKAYLTDDTNTGGRTFAVGGTNIKRRITGVADGSADSDAVTVAQLKKLSEKGITFKDDKDTKTTVGLAGEIKISGKEENNHRNISVTTNNKNLEVTLSKTLKGITSIENGNNSAKLTLNNDNITVNNKKLTGLANGSNDSDAVTYGQVKKPFKVVADNNANGVDHNLGNKIEITGRKVTNNVISSDAWDVKENNNPKKGRYTTENVETYVNSTNDGTKVLIGLREDPTFKKITLKDGDNKQVELTPTTDSLSLNSKKISGLSNGTNDTDAVAYGQVKNLFKIVADNNANGVDQALGKKIEITGRKNDGTSEAWDVNGNNPKKGRYTTENVETFVKTTGEGTQVLVGLREDPTFKKVTVGGENKTEITDSGINITKKVTEKNNKVDKVVKFGIDDKGNATLTDAQNKTASPIVTEATVGVQKIKYAATNGNVTTNPKKETTLTNGFNFSGGTNTEAEVGDNGVVKFNLKDKLTGITSIEKADKKAKITLNDDNITVNKKITGLADGDISDKSTDAVNGKQLNTVKTTADAAKSTADTVSNKITALEGKKLGFTGNSGNKVEKKLGEDIAIKGDDSSITTEAKNNAITIKVKDNGITSAKIADKNITEGKLADELLTKINAGNAVATNTITLSGDNGADNNPTKTSAVALNKAGGLSFGIKGADGIETTAKGTDVTVKLKDAYKTKLDNLANNAGDTYATKDLDNMTDTAKAKVKDLAVGAVTVTAGKGIQVTGTTGTNSKSYEVKLDDETQAKLNNISAKSDGRDGKEGKDLQVSNATHGLTGQDGLNGKDLTTKVNALRNGEAGTVIFTNEKGERVYKANNGKYYKKDDIETNGEAKAGKTGLENPELRVVNANGETTKATTLNNLASALSNRDTGKVVITAEKAKEVVATLLTKTDGLDKAVNLADLQAIAQAGLDFSGNTGTSHQALGTTLNIKGKEGVTYKEEDYTSDNVATKVTNGNIEIGFKKSPTFTKVTADEVETGKAKIKDELTFDKGDGKSTTIVAGDGNGSLLVNGKKVATSDSAPVLYTDDQGNIVEKGLDNKIYKTADLNGKRFDKKSGKYYNKNQFDNTGKLIDGATEATLTPVDADKVRHTLASLTDGSVKDAKVLDKVADGKIDANSKEAINGSQIKTMLDKLGVKIDDTTGVIKDPDVNKVEGDTDKPTSVIDGLNKVIDKVNSGITFGGDTGKEKQLLGSTLEVKTGEFETVTGTSKVKYVGTNIKTSYTKDTNTGNGVINIGITENPTFTTVNATDKVITNTVETKEISLVDKNDDTKKASIAYDDSKVKINGKEVATKEALDTLTSNNFKLTGDAGSTDNQALNKAGGLSFGIKGADGIETTAKGTDVTVKLKAAYKTKLDKLAEDAENTYAAKSELANKANKTLDNIDDTGINKIKDEARESIKVTSGNKISVTESKDETNHKTTYTVALDNDTVSTLNNIGKISDGKDGKNGTAGAGSHGLTGQDGLNGKDLTTKVNALRNGEAGTVIFTNEAGERLIKGNDGKYYKSNQLEANGDVKAEAKGKGVEDPELRLVNANGETTKSTTLNNLASALSNRDAGKAITAEKAKEVVEKLLTKTDGLDKAVNLADLQAIAQAGLDFSGNTGVDTLHHSLGTKLQIVGEGTPADNFVGASDNINVKAIEDAKNKISKLEIQLAKALKNIESIQNKDTKITLDNDKGVAINGKDGGTIVVKGKDDKDGVSIKGGDGTNAPTIAFNTTADNKGTGTITGLKDFDVNDKTTTYGQSGVAATQKEVKDYVAKEITKVNDSVASSTLNLSNGKETNNLNIKDETLEIANGTNTTVSLSKDTNSKKAIFKVNVNNNLTGITSIEKGDKKAKITLNDDNITVNTKITGLTDGTISDSSTDAINGKQFYTLSTNTIKLTADGVTEKSGVKKDDATDAKLLNTTGGISFGIKGADGIETTAKGTDVTVKLKAAYKTKLDNLADNAGDTYAAKSELANKANKTLDNIDDTGINKIKDKARESITVTSGTKISVKENKDETTHKTTYTVALDNDTVSTLNNIGKISDGKDGKNGTAGAGSHGLTGQDGLNGKDLTTKVNALRNGEAGTVVFTNKDGDRLVKANDGKYYKSSQVGTDGEVITPTGGQKPSSVETADIELRVVDSTGTTKTNIKLSNIADGKIDANSKEAINGSQIKTVLDKLGVKINNGTIEAPTITTLKGADGKDGETKTTLVDGLNEVISRVNSGIKYNADLGTEGTQQLGSVLNVNKATNTLTNTEGTNNINYVGDNLITKYTKNDTDGSGKLEIGFKESPTFKDLTATNGNFTNLKVKEKIVTKEIEFKDAVGNSLKLVSGQDGNLYINGVSVPTAASAPVLYTNKKGERVELAQDGNVYKPEDIKNLTYVKSNGTQAAGFYAEDQFEKDTEGHIKRDEKGNKILKAGATATDVSSKVYSDEVVHRLSPIKKDKTTPNKLTNLAEGDVSATSTDAINGGQLNNLGYMLGLEVNEKNTGFKAPEISDLKGTNATPANILDGLNQTREHINKGLTFEANYNADGYGKSSVNKILGKTLSITASGAENGKYAGKNNANYTGTNLATYVRTDTDGKKKFYIGMKETPTFKSINIGSTGFGDHQTDTGKGNITADDNGLTLTHDGASVTIAKDGDKAKISGLKDFDVNDKTTTYGQSGVAATQKEVKDYVAKEITKVNDSVASSTFKLSNGGTETKDLNIKDDTLEIANGTNTTVTLTKDDTNKKATFKVDVNNNLTGITSIEKVAKGTKITLNENDITVNKKITGLENGSISVGSKDAINGGQLNNLGYMLGLEVNEKNTGFKAPEISDLKGTNATPANILDGLNQTREHINKGLTFEANYNADSYGKSSVNKIFGKTLSIIASGAENGKYVGKDNTNYTGDNLATYVKQGKFYIGMKETPTFKEVKLSNSGKNVKFGIDNKGNATLTDGQNTTASPIVTEATVGNQKISYAANSENKKETTLTTGFNFTSDDLEIKTEDNGKVTFNLTDTVKNSLNGKGNDGRDGKSGTDGAGSKGLTGKDGLNGKDLTTKVNALRNGEAGTVVYTDKDGNRLVKSNDGKYYKAEYVEDNGDLKAGHSSVDEVKDILATLVNPDGSTKEPTTKLRVADGNISVDSKDAINGGQLNNLGYMLGLEVNGKNTGFKAPKISDLKGTNTTPANILDGLNQTREHINKGLTFEANYNADGYGTSNVNKIFGETLSITASGAENGKYAGKNNENYTGTNLATYVRTDTDGKKKFYIGMKETPTFKSINIGSTGFGDHQTDTGKGDITVDNEGLKLSYDKASITISKDGDKAKLSGLKDANIDENTYGTAGVAATQKEVKDYVAKEITKVNDSQSKLKNGTLGTVVYTDKDGNKLMKDIDGKFYKANADGTKEENAKEVVSENVILSTVKPDGTTTEPITLGNVASALGLSKDKKDKDNKILNKLINKEAKKDLKYTEVELNKVVTLRDLQFLASKGITFAGSIGTANKYLGDTITINESNSTGLTKDNFATKYETKNIAVKVDNTNGNIEVGLAKELSKINSITSEEDAKDKTKTKITLSKDGATFGVEKDDNTQVGAKTTIGKDGISITKQDEQNPSVSIKAGDTTKGPSIDFATKEEGQGNDKKTVGTGSITGLEYRKASDTNNNYGTGANVGRAATEGAVKEIYDKLSNVEGNINTLNDKGLTFVGNSGDAKVKKLGDTVNIKGEGTEANNFVSAKGNINVVANDSGVELQLAANLKNMKSFETENDKDGNSTKLDQKGLTITDKDDKNSGTKENPRNTVEITKDKIVFKKEYKEGTENKSDNGIVIDNSKGTISGVKDGDTPDSVVTKGYIDNKLKSLDGNKPFEYYEKNKDTVFAKDGTEYKAGTIVTEDGKVYAKGTQEVEGKYFAEGDKVVKAKDGKFYKEKDIKDRTYDEATKKWSGDSAQPTEATEAKALEGNDLKNAKAEDKVLVKGKDNKFYDASDFEKAEYNEAKNEYTKDGKKLEGKEAKDVVIKALPNNEAMTLSNIANARLVKDSKDAVNAGQMLEELDKKMNKDGSNIDKKEFANNVSEGANITKPEGILVTDKQVNEHLSKNYYNRTEVDAKVSNISNTVVEANKKSDLALGGVANAVAMANLLQANSYSKYKTNISAAYGYYGGSNALAIGFSGVSENRMVSYRVSGSVNTKGNIALGAGLGVMLGEFKTDKYPEKGKKISELEEKLRLQTEKTNKLEKQLEEILKLLKK